MKIQESLIQATVFLGRSLLVVLPLAAVYVAPPTSAANSEWKLIGGNEYEQHYSPLAQINTNTVRNLKLAWYADMPTRDGLTGIPIVVDGVVYQSGALGKVWANDVRTGKLLWTFDAGIKFPLDVIPSWGSRVSRGLTVWGDKVLKATGDCRLFALDRKTGDKVWEVQPCDPADFKTITGAPRVGDGKVFIGNSNADGRIGRGYVDAYEVESGTHLWRFYLIPGDPANGFENKAMEMASKTWGKEYWKKAGGGSAWEGITYDPRTHFVYIGTDSPSPFDPAQRGEGAGDELFTNAIVALNADTGEYVWHYSTTPGDGWDFNATSGVLLADLPMGNETRAVVMSAPKNGFFYVLDAYTGRLLNQPQNIVPVNWASKIDFASGRPVMRPEAQYWNSPTQYAIVSPSPQGAHNWMPMSFSPLTGLVYIPVTDFAARLGSDPQVAVGNLNIDFYYALKHRGTFQGTLLAWDPINQRPRWKVNIGRPYQGGTLATGGNIVFQGKTEGEFAAYQAETGEKLWSFPLDSGILAAPSTVEIDGVQLVLVAAGSGTTSSAVLFAADIAGRTTGPARLMAFSLSGHAKLPPSGKKLEPFAKPPAPEPNPTLARTGQGIWDANGCELCHGVQAIGGIGSVPDLRRIGAARLDLFPQIVRDGLLRTNGMPEFGDTIRDDELRALRAYILQQAWLAYRMQH